MMSLHQYDMVFFVRKWLGVPPCSAQRVHEPDPLLGIFLIPAQFSFENRRVAGNPKYRVLPDISRSGEPKILGIT